MPAAEQLEAIDFDASITLSVGWRSGAKVKLGQLSVGQDVAGELRSIVREAVDGILAREPAAWAPDTDLSVETYLTISRSDLGSAPTLAAEHQDAVLFDALGTAERLTTLGPAELPAADLIFYAITIGSDPGSRITFLRRVNPRRGLRGGRVFTSYSDVLTRIEDPVFAFDRDIDLVFVGDEALILSQSAFVALFRAQASLMALIPGWTTDLSGHIAISVAGQARLTAKATRDSRIRTRLEAVVKRGHLPSVPSQKVREKMAELELDQDRLIDSDGNLTFEDDDIALVLQFLNEDLFPGALTGTGFRADKKAAR